MCLWNPLDLLLFVNGLVEVQLEGVLADEQRTKVVYRLLLNELRWRPAEELVAALAVRAPKEALSTAARSRYWVLRGAIAMAEDLPGVAEEYFREASRGTREARVAPTSRARIQWWLARSLRKQGRYADAEREVREALRLAEDRSATANNRAAILNEPGMVFEAQEREALRLKEEGGETAAGRSRTLRTLVEVLRKLRRGAEARALEIEAARLAVDSGAPDPG